MEAWGKYLIMWGLGGEVIAVILALWAQFQAERGISANGAGDVLKALIAKLPWIAVMALVTIILGMVLLMGHWPWQSPPGVVP